MIRDLKQRTLTHAGRIKKLVILYFITLPYLEVVILSHWLRISIKGQREKASSLDAKLMPKFTTRLEYLDIDFIRVLHATRQPSMI